MMHWPPHMLWLPAFLLLLFSPCAFADAPGGAESRSFYFEDSVYFSLGMTFAADDFDDKIGQASKSKGFHIVDSRVKDARGYDAVLGKRLWPYLAVETQFEYSDGFQFTDRDGDKFRLEIFTATLNAKTFPLHRFLHSFNEGRLQPHLITGIGLMLTKSLDIDNNGAFVFRVGGGLDYFIDERWAVHLGTTYLVPVGVLRGLRFITTSVGLSYRIE